jgi:PAS domain S-box-containing protein
MIGEYGLMHDKYFDMLCNTGDGVYIVDANKHIVRWNKGAEGILKYPETDVLNQDCYRVISGRISSEKPLCSPNCKIHAGVLKGTQQKNFDVLTQTKEGEPLWLNVSIIAPSNGEESFVAHIFRDVTREKNTGLAVDQFLAGLGNQNQYPLDSAEQPTIRHIGAAKFPVQDTPPITLSGREIEVLTLLAEGLSTKSLAQKLNISHFTARNHIQNILVKLDLHSKAQAVSYAFKKGIL